MNLALLVLTLAAVQAPGAAKAAPMTVQVEASAKDAPGVTEWARELRTALEARKDEFRLVKPGEQAELVVRLDSVGGDASGAAILVLPDHPTPLRTRTHDGAPVPFCFARGDGGLLLSASPAPAFSESEAERTGVFVDDGPALMRLFLTATG